MNTVSLIGNLTRDPELRHTKGGTAVADLGVAVNSREKDSDGDWVDRADFFDVTVWGKTAENCAEYLEKGKKVGIVGRLRYETWENDEGQKRSKVKIVASTVEFLTPKGESGERSSGGSSVPAEEEYDLDDADDDIPF